MTRTRAIHQLLLVIGLLFILLVAIQSPAATLHHRMQVELYPGLKMLKAQDTITFPAGSARKSSFLLHKDLRISVLSPGDSLVILHAATTTEPYVEYGLELGSQDNKVSFVYSGVVYDPVVDDSSRGLISAEGAALFGETYWYPSFLGQQKSFEVTVKTPLAWRALVQGQLTSTSVDRDVRTSVFAEIYPQEEIYLVAGAFHIFEVTPKSGPKVQVLLRKDEPAVAQSFLNLVPDYISYYAKEIAAYPYSTFTVVENFWETGYGMPSFTLLGPTVLRLPFILNSSLPHEVLHNWWGNSVYVDYDKGNWSEGLTTYMADHWQQQLAGTDRDYRLNTLIRYNDFVTQTPEKDFPLRQFKGRHNSSSQAIGYGKSMMIFRMLEFRFGKDLFRKTLQDFYKENIYRKVSFTELQTSFEKSSNQDLTSFFSQWLDRKGAPLVALPDVKVVRGSDGLFSTTYLLAQTQADIYDLVIPVVWQLESGEEVRQVARLTDRSQIYSFVSRSRPLKISVDPNYEIFRQLYLEERPATLSSIFGSAKVSFYADPQDTGAQAFVKAWAQQLEGTTANLAVKDLTKAPKDSALVLVGDHPEFRLFMEQNLAGQDFNFSDTELKVQGQNFLWDEASSVLVTRLKSNPQQTVVWVRWSRDNNPAEWAARLTHYGTFGVLIFKGRPVVLKSTWPVLFSPLQKLL